MKIPGFIKAVAKHCGKKSCRGSRLDALRYERDGDGNANLVASDGRQLICLSYKDATDFPRAFNCDTKHVVKTMPTGGELAGLDRSAGRIPALDGSYPQWREVFRFDEDGAGIALDARLLKKFCDTVVAARKASETATIQLYLASADGALGIRADADDGTEIRGVIMPVVKDDYSEFQTMRVAMSLDKKAELQEATA